ncbi:SNF2-related protein [Rhodoferax sp.]|uniref:DEAD/DEAH box helicase n=1 Tax=Rhodoferax sp. TaxID=50421 RepID=UPI002757C45D|nr:DEAD/DEAH box helicase [Rhodoferax sp.]
MTISKGLWFEPTSLQEQCEKGAWERGLALFRNQQVLSLDIEPLDDYWLLLGEVQGSQREPYEVSVEMDIDEGGQLDYWDGDCTCPVGVNCKHCVAVLLKAMYQGRRILGSMLDSFPEREPTPEPTPEQVQAQRQAAQQRADELARQVSEQRLLGWLARVDYVAGRAPLPDAAASAYAPRPVEQRDEKYLYLLSVQAPGGPSPQLVIEVMLSYRKQDGDWAKPKAFKTLPSSGTPAYDRASDADRLVLQLVRALGVQNFRYSSYGGTSALLDGMGGALALEQAASTGRLLLRDVKAQAGAPLAWGPALPLHWSWQAVTVAGVQEPHWQLRAALAEAGAVLCHNQPPLYLDVARARCGPVQAAGVSTAQLAEMLKAPPFGEHALKAHPLALTHSLGPLPMPSAVPSMRQIQGVQPVPCLRLTPTPTGQVPAAGLIQARLEFDYDGQRGWWSGQGRAVVVEAGSERLLLQREVEAEMGAIDALLELGLHVQGRGQFLIPGDQSQQPWLRWADDDFAVLRQAGFAVTLDDSLHGWIQHAQALDVSLQAQEGDLEAASPWFDLSLGMEINGQRHNVLPWLPELIAAAAQGPRDPETGQPQMPPFVYLRSPDGQGFVRLSTDAIKPWMAALLELVGERGHDFSGDSLKLSRLDALRTAASLGEGVAWDGAQALREMVQQLAGRAELPVVSVPASVQASLRPYQQQGLNWLQFLRQHGLDGILADDMGLGKTLQTLAHIQVEKDAGRLTHPALIIAPVSLMGNWLRETQRFCPALRAMVLHGKERHDAAHAMTAHDIVIAPYSLLQRDKERWLQAQWHLVVLDEAQNIKNASTHAAQVVGQLRTRHRLCLSGTPMENHLGEIWSLFHFLMPGFLGSQQRFKELFRTPIEKLGDPERLAQLRARITPFMLRRTKALVASELPPKVETITRVELLGKQADLYETIRLGMEKTVREALDAKGLAKSQITILDALLKLRQVCCDPNLLKLPAARKVKTSAKLEQLMELLPEMVLEGRRILLFSQFTSMLSLIEVELRKHGITWAKLTGQTQKRDAVIEQFTSGAVPVFLISLKAGGVGLNLPQADTVIHYDPWWNPAVENQATDRAHRIGQTHTVFVYKLVAQGTIEERILALQERKAALAEGMYSGAVGRKQPLFTESDLAELLRPLSA